MPNDSVFSVDTAFKDEVRRRDDIIRNLGAESDKLAREVDSKKKEISRLSAELDGLNSKISDANAKLDQRALDLDTHEKKIVKALDDREAKLTDNVQKHTDNVKSLDKQKGDLEAVERRFEDKKKYVTAMLEGVVNKVTELCNKASKDIEKL